MSRPSPAASRPAEADPAGIPGVPAWVLALAGSRGDPWDEPVGCGAAASLRLSQGRRTCVITASLPSATRLAAPAFQASVEGLCGAVMQQVQSTPAPHVVRMWSFIPGIHAPMDDGLDRYRLFNAGRFDAFARRLGGAGRFAAGLPAASAVGHDGDDLVVWAIGAAEPGVPIENPRQTRAFEYSAVHGPRPPCFSRAMVAALPAGDRLLVSGTASILGETSAHPGSLDAQLAETITNLRSLLDGTPPGRRFRFEAPESVRIYFVRPSDAPRIREILSSAWPAAGGAELVRAAICRPELLVEVEATFAPVS